MRIAFIISSNLCISSHSGIRIQADTWAGELKRQGHDVIKVNPWDYQDWKTYDVIHLIGYSEFIPYLDGVYQQNKNIIFSPIIDSMQNIRLYRFITYWGCKKLRLTSNNYEMRLASKYITKWSVRTKFEYRYVNEAYGVPVSKISLNPLSYRLSPGDYNPERKPYCLHVSKLTDGRKNVMRLVQAAERYHFNLKLAGSISSETDFSPIKEIIDRNENIEYLGRVSDKELLRLYQDAKVFALPSVIEGVGLVALEAAACGCDIVVTNVGGPKEYYGDMAFHVNPLSIESIGEAVMKALNETSQPELRDYVMKNYSQEKCVSDMAVMYKRIKERI